MGRIIISVDMDAFFAAVEIRDNPELAGKPLVIGALPHERGVVSTCSYEARKYGVRSAMSIKEAYRLCPNAVFMHPNFSKYKEASDITRSIWCSYSDIVEFVSIDEGFLDVTRSAHLFGGAWNIGHLIKERTKKETGLTCSVGIGYSLTSAKLASEEQKPDGLYEIPTPEFMRNLIIDRDVRILYTVGGKTAEKLYAVGIHTVRDLLRDKRRVINLLGSHGEHIITLAEGIDNRQVTPHGTTEAHSVSKEQTFQQDVTDMDYLKDMLRLLIKELSLSLRLDGIYCGTVTVKVKYFNMKAITRSKSGEATHDANTIYNTAAALLDTVDKRPIRLIGVGLSNLTKSLPAKQLSLDDIGGSGTNKRLDELDNALLKIHKKYGSKIIKTGSELAAEKRFKETGGDGTKT